jgi:hypothetical protein
VDVHKLETILLRETKGEGSKFNGDLGKMLEDWEFISIDSVGHYGGLVTGRGRRFLKCSNALSFDSRLGVVLYSRDLGKEFIVLNIYGPYENDLLG